MNFHVIETGHLMLDGGAMFGVVPKNIWNQLNPANENNLNSWAMRCLLVEDGDQLILVDTGMGNKQSEKFFSYYEPHGEGELKKSIRAAGFGSEEVTDVILTHLHFDHCGGSVDWNSDRSGYQLAFPNARFWVDSKHWELANEPNPREAASFLTENIQPIQEAGQLYFIDRQKEQYLSANIELVTVNGHTEGQVIPIFHHGDQSLAYVADLIPSVHHIKPHYVPAYDTTPLLSMTEKQAFVERAFSDGVTLFYEHDPVNECSQIIQTERGLKAGPAFALNSMF